MPYPYTSIFDGATILTRKDLCELLNLDTSRKDLKFSDAEIRKAYKARALRFHPDKQMTMEHPIPKETCQLLMNDIGLAREYMLKGTAQIIGKAYLEKEPLFKPDDWVTSVIEALHSIKEGTSSLSSGVGWLNRLSRDYLMVGVMSTFWNGQLNFHYVNYFSAYLGSIRPYLLHIDGTIVATFLRILKTALNTADQLNAVSLFDLIKKTVPKPIAEHPQLDTLFAEIKATGNELKNMLTDDFIDQVQHIIQFWPHFVATVPSWSHIMGVYFVSLIVTASTLPSFFNASKVISEVILQQKGALALGLTALPLFLLTAAVLPINIIVQLAKQLVLIALKDSYYLLIAGYRILASLFQLPFLLSTHNDKSFSQIAFSLFENIFTISVRLSIHLTLEVLDAIIYIFTSKSPFSSLLEKMSTSLDSWLTHLRPAEMKKLKEHQVEEKSIIPLAHDKKEPVSISEEPKPILGFFAESTLPLHNKNDLWLERLLAEHSPQEELLQQPLERKCA